MLVKLYELPSADNITITLASKGILIRRALIPEKHIVLTWVKEHFSAGWVDECDAAFSGHPITCFVATFNNKLIGFGVYDAISLGVFGPLGIDDKFRGCGVGKALTIQVLYDMRNHGYSYAIIGWLKPQAQLFFKRTINAEVIKESSPERGMYKDLLVGKSNPEELYLTMSQELHTDNMHAASTITDD
jgi:GNAT superfamily N-acetyltransferase